MLLTQFEQFFQYFAHIRLAIGLSHQFTNYTRSVLNIVIPVLRENLLVGYKIKSYGIGTLMAVGLIGRHSSFQACVRRSLLFYDRC